MRGQREIILILGQTGSGKTTAAKKICAGYSRVLVLEAGFAEYPATYQESADDVLLYLEHAHAFPREKSSLVPFAVGFTPLTSEYDFCFDLARELGNLTVVMDEGDRFDPREIDSYDEIITRGRHWGVSLVVVGLHAYALPKNLRRQATRVQAFRQVESSDLDALAETVGPIAYSIGPDSTGRFQVPDFCFLDWTPKNGARLFNADGTQRKDLTVSKVGAILPNVPPESAKRSGGIVFEDSARDIDSGSGETKCPKSSASPSASS